MMRGKDINAQTYFAF